MGIYSRWVLPRIVDVVCNTKPTRRQRREVVPGARGRVLEIGFGSGHNLPFLGSEVEKVWALEPSLEMWALARDRIPTCKAPIEHLHSGSEEIPLTDSCVDTVLVTYVLCTIPDLEGAFQEMRRVLHPEGRLLFCEHGAAPDPAVARWQDRLNPIWKQIGGGCHLNRRIPELLEQAGFHVQGLQAAYIPGWKPASFNYWGTATVG